MTQMRANSFSMLYLPNFWQSVSSPYISVMADISQLSLPEVRLALPYLTTIIAYQLVGYCQQSTAKLNALNTFIQQAHIGDSQVSADSFFRQSGFNFASIEPFMHFASELKQQLFANEIQYYQLLGFLTAHTHIPINKLEKLLQWQSLISLLSFHIATQEATLSQTQIETWISLQPWLGAKPADTAILAILNIQLPASFQHLALQKTHFLFETYTWLSPLKTSLDRLIHCNFFNITPPNNLIQTSKLDTILPNAIPRYAQHKPLMASTIFSETPHAPTNILQIVQRYWLLTSILLTGLVFGAMSLLNSSLLSKNESQTQLPLDKDNISHDIAIMKVDNEMSTVNNRQTNKPATKSLTQTHTLNKPLKTEKPNKSANLLTADSAKSKNATATSKDSKKTKNEINEANHKSQDKSKESNKKTIKASENKTNTSKN